ncbi:Ribosomal protein S3 mitochondrial [Bienertia sinuspersici]
MRSLLSNRTNTNTLIESVKIKSVYQSASPIAQDISFQPKKKRGSFRSIFSKIVKKIPLVMKKGVEGIRICCSGRLEGAEIAKTECGKYGKTSCNVLHQKIDYASAEVSTRYGIVGVKLEEGRRSRANARSVGTLDLILKEGKGDRSQCVESFSLAINCPKGQHFVRVSSIQSARRNTYLFLRIAYLMGGNREKQESEGAKLQVDRRSSPANAIEGSSPTPLEPVSVIMKESSEYSGGSGSGSWRKFLDRKDSVGDGSNLPAADAPSREPDPAAVRGISDLNFPPVPEPLEPQGVSLEEILEVPEMGKGGRPPSWTTTASYLQKGMVNWDGLSRGQAQSDSDFLKEREAGGVDGKKVGVNERSESKASSSGGLSSWSLTRRSVICLLSKIAPWIHRKCLMLLGASLATAKSPDELPEYGSDHRLLLHGIRTRPALPTRSTIACRDKELLDVTIPYLAPLPFDRYKLRRPITTLECGAILVGTALTLQTAFAGVPVGAASYWLIQSG